ncbi:hypothetical protein EUGRSUZ_C02147 [Eucalyptus grandis]|uniref:Uncharacterized protein n=2 Tax=Eucalyptus grandis TaxID=71139 RepID=A0ACC3LFD4_EUCGR|nr:hypothetical protein EUGRSUZ_C02147 [Eucalyptus grandis]
MLNSFLISRGLPYAFVGNRLTNDGIHGVLMIIFSTLPGISSLAPSRGTLVFVYLMCILRDFFPKSRAILK